MQVNTNGGKTFIRPKPIPLFLRNCELEFIQVTCTRSLSVGLASVPLGRHGPAKIALLRQMSALERCPPWLNWWASPKYAHAVEKCVLA